MTQPAAAPAPPSPTLATVGLTPQEVVDSLAREHGVLLVEVVQLRAIRVKLEQVIRDQETRILQLAAQVPADEPTAAG